MSGEITFTISGIDALASRLATLGNRAAEWMAQALYLEAEAVMTASKRMVPVDTGALRASGYVKEPEIAGSQVKVTMGYGGSASQYAIFVH